MKFNTVLEFLILSLPFCFVSEDLWGNRACTRSLEPRLIRQPTSLPTETGSQLPWRFRTTQPSPSWSSSSDCCWPPGPAEVWALMEGLLLLIRHLKARRGSSHSHPGQGAPWSVHRWLVSGRESLIYFQSKNLAHSSMEVALPSEGPHPLWVPMSSSPRKRKVPGNDFPTSC